jgi:hypothetical protein
VARPEGEAGVRPVARAGAAEGAPLHGGRVAERVLCRVRPEEGGAEVRGADAVRRVGRGGLEGRRRRAAGRFGEFGWARGSKGRGDCS